MNNNNMNQPITIIGSSGISGYTLGDTTYLNIEWHEFDQKFIKRDEAISNNTSPFILTTDWSNNITKIDKFILIKDEILQELQVKLDMKENEPDNVKEAWRDVKDAVTAYMIAQKLAN